MLNVFLGSSLVRPSVAGRHRVEEDLATLYHRLANLGIEYYDGRAALADLENTVLNQYALNHKYVLNKVVQSLT